MYKLNNGMVFFDKETVDEYLKQGYKIVEQQTTINQIIEEANDEQNDIDEQSISKVDKRAKKPIK